MECLTNFLTTGAGSLCGALCGAYAAYCLAECRLHKRENYDFLALLLVLHEELDGLLHYLSDYNRTMKDGKEHASYEKPFIVPDITHSQIQRLMEISPDKDMVFSIMAMMRFCKMSAAGIKNGGSMLLPIDTVRDVKKQLEYELVSLEVQYTQNRNKNENFPSNLFDQQTTKPQ